MNYVETLRVRNSLALFTAITAVLIFSIIALVLSSVKSGGAVHVDKGSGVSLSGVFGVCGYCMAVFATVVGTSLSCERRRVLAWTRPLSRMRLLLSYAAVDVAGIVVAFAIVMVLAALLPLAIFGQLSMVRLDGHEIPTLLLFFGMALMWYAVLQAATAWLPFPGGAVAGISWGVFITLVTLEQAPLPSAAHALVTALNFVNPVAYVSGVHFTVDGNGHASVHTLSVIALDSSVRTVIVYAIAIVAEIAAIAGWKRAEL